MPSEKNLLMLIEAIMENKRTLAEIYKRDDDLATAKLFYAELNELATVHRLMTDEPFFAEIWNIFFGEDDRK